MRVIDFSMLTPGAFCSQILADLGATVLKVERPEGGFRCADGGWVTITASENHPFPALTGVIGRPEMGRDPANASYASRKASAAGINAAVREWVAGHDRATVEPTHGQASSNHVWNAQGTIAGNAVIGWLGFNTHFQKPGVTYRVSPMARGQMVFWADVGNVFEDGSWEQGPVLIGRDGFSAAWITCSDGRSIVSNHVEADFDLDEDGWAREVRCRFVDSATGERQEWSWRPKPGSNMVELPHAAPYLRHKRSAEGTFTRVGENRTLKHSSAWPDFQVDGRIEALLAEQAARRSRMGGQPQ